MSLSSVSPSYLGAIALSVQEIISSSCHHPEQPVCSPNSVQCMEIFIRS